MMNNNQLIAIAKSVRSLAMDAVEQANSGHPGLPLGLAELGALLYGEFLQHNPVAPRWLNRDRFVLSAGHGSMLQYALLHLAGFDLSLDDIKQFRQLHSRTPGHPEYGMTAGVETTTGPLGQGFANAVGFAIAEAHLHPQFSDAEGALIDHHTFCIASDGDLMEGVCAEAASLAGHLQLGKMIVFYDDNGITIEGQTSLTVSENTEQRFAAYGWQTLSASAYNASQIRHAVEMAKSDTLHPTLIRVQSVIGKGAPHKEGTAAVHGAPLGADEITETRQALEIEQSFFIDPQAVHYFKELRVSQADQYMAWCTRVEKWSAANPAQYQRWQHYFGHLEYDYTAVDIPSFAGETGTTGANTDAPAEKNTPSCISTSPPIATRNASGTILQALVTQIPHLIGGSADLGPSNKTVMKDIGHFSAHDRIGRLLHFGLREHAMGGIANGLSLYGAFRPFCATFLVFSDYMRASIRLAALMHQPIIYVFSHDSIYVGEDGPTHQPIEHLAALRIIPHLIMYRPADAEETAAAWRFALDRRDAPTALVLSRQNLPLLIKSDPQWQQNMRHHGAYMVRKERGKLRTIVLASGSEVSLAAAAAEQVDGNNNSGNGVRVISVCCRELFERAPRAYRDTLLVPAVRIVVVEAGVAQGWEHFVQSSTDLVTLSDFGASGAKDALATHYHFTVEYVANLLHTPAV